MRAEVSMLSRNVRVVGQSYSKIVTQAFGARILVGTMSQDDKSYKGFNWSMVGHFYVDHSA